MHDQMSENYCVKCVIRCGLGCGHHYGDECAETEKPVSDVRKHSSSYSFL